MATPASQLEIERWRALALTLGDVKADLAAIKDQLSAANLSDIALTNRITAIEAKLTAIDTAQSQRPLSQVWTAFLVGDWKTKAALILPPILLAYAFASGQPIAAVASDVLTTARICVGRTEPTNGP